MSEEQGNAYMIGSAICLVLGLIYEIIMIICKKHKISELGGFTGLLVFCWPVIVPLIIIDLITKNED